MLHAHHRLYMALLFIVLFVLSTLSLGIGAVEVKTQTVLLSLANQFFDVAAYFPQYDSILSSNQFSYHDMVVWDLRLPRLVLAIFVGAALASSGAAIQGLFRNPLADPALIGVSAGAALGAVSVIVLGQTALGFLVLWLGEWAISVAAFTSGLFITVLSYRIATKQGTTDVSTLLLAGIAINAIAMAGTGVLIFIADDAQLRSITFWNMGSLTRASWTNLLYTLPFIIPSLVLLPVFSKPLNAFLMGESVAGHIGFSVKWTKRFVIFLTALAVSASVSITGVIGFLGLVVPHIIRMAVGPDHRFLLPASMIFGAILIVCADMIARTVVAPAEMPIGLLMSIFGGPFFLYILIKKRSIGG